MLQPLLVAGGFGLILRRREIDRRKVETLLDLRSLEQRSTGDVDLMLPVTVIAEVNERASLRAAFEQCGYSPVPGNELWQFHRQISTDPNDLWEKFDLMAPLPSSGEKAQVVDHRVKPLDAEADPRTNLHARKTPEAIAVQEEPMIVTLPCSDGPVAVGVINLLTFAILKLHASRDRIHAEDNHHPYDLYLLLASATLKGIESASEIARRHHESPVLEAARLIASQHFGSLNAPGSLAIQNYSRDNFGLTIPKVNIERALALLRALVEVEESN